MLTYTWLALVSLAAPAMQLHSSCPASFPRRAVTAVAPAMQANRWLTVTAMVMCLMCGQPWNWYSDEVVLGRQLSSAYAATEATLQAVRVQLSDHHAATDATLQAVRAQLGTQQAVSEAALQAVQEQARLLAAHVGGPVPAEQLTGGHSITWDPPHSEAPAVSLNC